MQSALPFDDFPQPRRNTTMALVRKIKETNEDFEFYPTTDEILQTIKNDIDSMIQDRIIEPRPSILDCGAGDGRSLMKLTDGKRYAIEKSKPLIQAMDSSIFVIGADFHQQTFMDKSCSIAFSNPPYSEYAQWSSKIIKESQAGYIYLVIPQRWSENQAISNALELRSAEAKVLGHFDFLEADRKARAVVDIVKVNMRGRHSRYMHGECKASTDAFSTWFEETFDIKAGCKHSASLKPGGLSKERVDNALVAGSDIVTALVSLYEADMANLLTNYRKFESLDASLLKELGVSWEGVKEGLREKVAGLKKVYWQELFGNLTQITDKLTKTSRESMLETLMRHTGVDFNASNAYAILIWTIKNANLYFDDQLVSFVTKMVDKANVVLYKSNQKTFRDEAWRYCRQPEGLDKFKLDYRVVMSRVGGICVSDWKYETERYNGLTESAYFYLLDLLTIASNLGFDTTGHSAPMSFDWTSGKANDFTYTNHKTGNIETLASVKAYKNGNLHIKYNQELMCKMNLEFGRLKGWLKTAHEAAAEMDIPLDIATQSFNSNLRIEVDAGLLMITN